MSLKRKPSGVATKPYVDRALTQQEQEQIETTIQQLQTDKQPYKVIANTLKEYVKQQGIPHKSSAWITVMRRLGRLKSQMVSASCLGGRPNVIDAAIKKGQITRENIYDQLLIYQAQQAGKKWHKREIYKFMMNWLNDKYNMQLESWRTIERWIHANPIPENYEDQHAKPFQTWNSFTDPQTNPAWGKLDRELFSVAKDSYKMTATVGIKNFWLFMKAKGNPSLLNPSKWNAQHVNEWITFLFDSRGMSSNSIRGYLVGIRRFLDIGLNWSSGQMREIRLKRFGEKTRKKLPEKIIFFIHDQITNMIDHVPSEITYQVYSAKRGAVMEKRYHADEYAKVTGQTGISLMSTTGARVGFVPKTRWWRKHVETMNVYERAFNDANGICSIRLADINIDVQQRLRQANGEFKTVTMWTITKIHEKMSEVWSNKGQGLFITPEAEKLVKHLLCLLLKLSQDTDNATLKLQLQEYVNRKKQEFDELSAQVSAKVKRTKELNPEKLQKILTESALDLKAKYAELLLLIPDPNLYHSTMYAACENATRLGTPVRDNEGNIIDSIALSKQPHKGHLLRKSFAQNLKAQGYGAEDIIEFQVGWTDLSTFFLYYGKATPELLQRLYFALLQ